MTYSGKPDSYLYQGLETWVEEGQMNKKWKVLGNFAHFTFFPNSPKQ